jgi:hypothetical protein
VNTMTKQAVQARVGTRVLVMVAVCAASISMPAHLAAQSATTGAKPVAKPTAKTASPKYDASKVLNKALRQPMLAERSTKAFLMISLKALVFRSRNQLDDSLAEFDKVLKELIVVAPTAEIRDNYQLLDQLFDEYKTIKLKPVNAQSATELAEQNEELVWIAQKGAALLQAHTNSTRNDLIATAGSARVLSQRIAKLYLFRAAGIRSNVIADDLKTAESEYRNAINRLLRATQNTEAIRSELSLAESQWIFLKQAIERLNANRTSTVDLEHVSKACDNILEVMDRVTRLYEGV